MRPEHTPKPQCLSRGGIVWLSWRDIRARQRRKGTACRLRQTKALWLMGLELKAISEFISHRERREMEENKVSAEVREAMGKILAQDVLTATGLTVNLFEPVRYKLMEEILSIEGIAIVDRNATGLVTIHLGELAFEIPVEKLKEQDFVREVKRC